MFFVHTHTKYDRHIQNPPQLCLEDSTEWQTGSLYSSEPWAGRGTFGCGFGSNWVH